MAVYGCASDPHPAGHQRDTAEMWPAEPYRAYPRRLDQVVLALTVVVLAGLGAASDGALGLVFAVLAASVAASLAAYAVMEMCGPPG